jgi:DNA-binding NarL/FixJ family response regulator
VVLAEDHPAMATELHALLITDFDIVGSAHDGVALIEATRRTVPDAIVCDIAMPRLNGLAAAASILAARPDTPIVFVTVQDSRAVIRKAIDCGARGYVLKSDARHELVAAVHAALEGGFYLSANVRRLVGMTQHPPADGDDGS